MSKIQQPIIYIKYIGISYPYQYQLNTDAQSEIDLNDLPEQSISCRECRNAAYVAFKVSNHVVVIHIDDDCITDTLIKIEHHYQESILLHVHVVETLDDNIVIFVIFTNHILRIHLTNTSDGYLFEKCKTNVSLSIPSIEIISFRLLLNDENECLRVHLVLDETCSKKFVFYQITLMNDDKCIFYMTSEVFFKLPPNMIEIEINGDSHDLDDLTTMLRLTIETERKVVNLFDLSNKIDIIITHEKEDYPSRYSGALNYGDDDKIFLLTKDEMYYLMPFDKIERFRVRGGFEIVATIKCETYGLFDDEYSQPEIGNYFRSFMKLNKYHMSEIICVGGYLSGNMYAFNCASDSD